MKKFVLFAAAMSLLGWAASAAEVPMKFNIINKANTTLEDGVVTVKNTDAKGGGVNAILDLNQTKPTKIVLSGESKCDESNGIRNAHDYSLYIDLTYSDGTKKYGVIVPFDPQNREWQKKVNEFMPPKPIKQARIYILFRFHTGAAQFKNLKFEEIKETK